MAHRSFTVSDNAYSVLLLNFMSSMLPRYAGTIDGCVAPRLTSHGLMLVNSEGFTTQANLGKKEVSFYNI